MTPGYYATDGGNLCDYETGEILRDATAAEIAASRDAALHDGGAGVIGEEDLTGPEAEATTATQSRSVSEHDR